MPKLTNLPSLATMTRGDPGLVLQVLDILMRQFQLARVVLGHEPDSDITTLAEAHFREAATYLRQAEAHMQQCLRLRVLPHGAPPTPDLSAEIQAALAPPQPE